MESPTPLISRILFAKNPYYCKNASISIDFLKNLVFLFGTLSECFINNEIYIIFSFTGLSQVPSVHLFCESGDKLGAAGRVESILL